MGLLQQPGPRADCPFSSLRVPGGPCTLGPHGPAVHLLRWGRAPLPALGSAPASPPGPAEASSSHEENVSHVFTRTTPEPSRLVHRQKRWGHLYSAAQFLGTALGPEFKTLNSRTHCFKKFQVALLLHLFC